MAESDVRFNKLRIHAAAKALTKKAPSPVATLLRGLRGLERATVEEDYNAGQFNYWSGYTDALNDIQSIIGKAYIEAKEAKHV